MSFELGEKVYLAIDPEYTENNEAAIECWISKIYLEQQEESTSVYEYELTFKSFDEDTKSKPNRLFKTSEEATAFMRSNLLDKINKLEKRLNSYYILIGEDKIV